MKWFWMLAAFLVGGVLAGTAKADHGTYRQLGTAASALYSQSCAFTSELHSCGRTLPHFRDLLDESQRIGSHAQAIQRLASQCVGPQPIRLELAGAQEDFACLERTFHAIEDTLWRGGHRARVWAGLDPILHDMEASLCTIRDLSLRLQVVGTSVFGRQTFYPSWNLYPTIHRPGCGCAQCVGVGGSYHHIEIYTTGNGGYSGGHHDHHGHHGHDDHHGHSGHHDAHRHGGYVDRGLPPARLPAQSTFGSRGRNRGGRDYPGR